MKEIHILGTAPSIREYVPTADTIKIGVNDIWKHHEVDFLVLMDNINTFKDDRQETIKNSKPQKVFTTLQEWKKFFPNCKIMDVYDKRGFVETFDDYLTSKYLRSVDSTFTAVHIAYKMGARKIVMHGVDFYGHLLEVYHRLTILRTYSDLYTELRNRGVELYVYNDDSLLVEAGIPFLHRSLPLGGYMQRVRPLLLDEKPRDLIADREKELYTEIWKSNNYASHTQKKFFPFFLENSEFGFVLEIGCGNGELCENLRRNGRVVYGLDITLKGIKNHDNIDLYRESAAWDIPFYGDAFDYTISTDVLEHIPPEKVDKTICELIRVTSKKSIHAIATRPATFQHKGIQLHPTVKPLEWWYEKFKIHNKKGIEIILVDVDKPFN